MRSRRIPTITTSSATAIAEPHQVEVGGVEDGDHHDRADVVDDRQRQQEQPGGRRDPAAEQAEHADRERDVGGHRDAPARRSPSPPPTTRR